MFNNDRETQLKGSIIEYLWQGHVHQNAYKHVTSALGILCNFHNSLIVKIS